jgi:hypothetical protein
MDITFLDRPQPIASNPSSTSSASSIIEADSPHQGKLPQREVVSFFANENDNPNCNGTFHIILQQTHH